MATPSKFPSWKNCTWVMAIGLPRASLFVSVAVAVMTAVPPPLSVDPMPGDVIATVGSDPMITAVGAGVSVGDELVVEAMTLFFPSYASAVRLYTPVTVGCHWKT